MLWLDISDNNFEEIVRAVRQAQAMITFNSMRVTATKRLFEWIWNNNRNIGTIREETDGDDTVAGYILLRYLAKQAATFDENIVDKTTTLYNPESSALVIQSQEEIQPIQTNYYIASTNDDYWFAEDDNFITDSNVDLLIDENLRSTSIGDLSINDLDSSKMFTIAQSDSSFIMHKDESQN